MIPFDKAMKCENMYVLCEWTSKQFHLLSALGLLKQPREKERKSCSKNNFDV